MAYSSGSGRFKAVSRFLTLGFAVVVALGLTTCDLFKVGLGKKVDINAPTISISSPASGDYKKGAIDVTGACSDDIGVTSVVLSAGGTNYTATVVEGATWTVSVDTTALASAGTTFTATASDASGKTGSTSILVYVDNTPPTILATSPLTYDAEQPTFYRSIEFKGEVYDSSPITDVKIQICNSAGVPVSGTEKTANGTNTWSVQYSYDDLSSRLSNNGTYYYNVIATDQADNSNSYFFHRYDVYPLLSSDSNGYVTFPSMYDFGQLDQTAATELSSVGLSKAELDGIKLGSTATHSPAYPDFLYMTSEGAKVQWLNLSGASPVINIGGKIVGTILPPSDGSSILQSSVSVVIRNQTTSAEYAISSSDILLEPVGSSLNFTITPEDASNANIPSGNYRVTLSYKTNAMSATALPVSSQQAFGISAGAPILKETDVGGTDDPDFPGPDKRISPVYAQAMTSANVTMGGNALKSDGTAGSITLSYSLDGGTTVTPMAPTAYDADGPDDIAGTPDDGAWSYLVDVDTDGPAGSDTGLANGSYTFTIIAENGGLSASLTRMFVIDTNAPVITILSPTANQWVTAGAGATLDIAGTAADSGGSGVMAVRYLIAPSAENHSTDDFSAWAAAKGTISWTSPDTPIDISALAVGSYQLWIGAVDAAGNGSIEPVTFGVDNASPALTVSTVVPAYYTVDTFTISGYATDDNVIDGLAPNAGSKGSLTISINSGTAQPISVDADGPDNAPGGGDDGYWTYTASGMADGAYTLVFTATDQAGKRAAATRSTRVDTTHPALSLSNLANGDFIGTSSYTIKGTASDDNGIASISYSLNGGTNWYPITASSSWSCPVTGLTEGAGNTVRFLAEDGAGNQTNLPASGDITFGLDLSNPRATEVLHGAALIQSRVAVPFAGVADDASFTAGRAAASAVIKWTKNGVAQPDAPLPLVLDPDGFDDDPGTTGDNNTNWFWSLPADLDGSDDGLYVITLTVTDVADKVSTETRTVRIDTTAPIVSITSPVTNEVSNSSSYTISGTSRDTGVGFDGTEDVRYSFDNVAWTAFAGVEWDGYTWTKAITIPGSEGLKTLYIESFDRLGTYSDAPNCNRGTASVTFSYDAAPPTLTEANTTDTIYRKTDLTFGGTVNDSNRSADPVISLKVNGTETVSSIPYTYGSSWSHTFDIDGLDGTVGTADDMAEGTYTLEFVARDAVGKTDSETRTVCVDRSAPTLNAVTWPASDYVNRNGYPYYRVSGVTSDTGSGTKDVLYCVTSGAASAAPALGDPAWISMGGLSSWIAMADLSSTAEGAYTIHVVAQDKADNYSALAERTFYVDAAAPEFGTSFTPAANSVYGTGFNLVGSSVDTYLSSTTASIQVGASSLPLTNSGTADAWSFAVPGSVTISSDGTYTISVTARDYSGQIRTATWSFRRDTQAPLVSFSNLPNSPTAVFTDSNPAVLGLITDATEIGTVTYHFEKWNGSAWAMPAGHTERPLTVTAGSTSHGFSIRMVTDAGLTTSDGRWRIVMTAADKANASVNSLPTTSSEFFLDQNNPEISITAPASSGSFAKLSDSLTVSGTASDTGSGLASVVVRVTRPDSSIATDTILPGEMTGTAWTTTFAAGVFTVGGTYNVLATATDAAGRIKELTRDVICDTALPVISFTSPYAPPATQPSAVIGEITVAGKTADDSMQSVGYIVGGTLNTVTGVVTYGGSFGTTTTWIAFDNSYSWSAKINSTGYATVQYAVQRATPNYWDLPIHVRAIDTAGNIAYSTLSVWIDTDIDKPVASILSPSNNATMGGSFLVSGGATDNTFVNKVYMQVEVEGATYTAGTDGSGVAYQEIADLPGSMTGINAAGTANVRRFARIGDSETAWYEVDTGTTAWRVMLNTLGEFYLSTMQGLASQAANSTLTGNIIIRVKARDSKYDPFARDSESIYGNYDQITVKLDESVPSITELAGNPVTNSYVKGNITLHLQFTDDVAIGSVSIVSSAGTNFPITEGTEVAKTIENAPYGYRDWVLTKTINTDLLAPSGSGTIDLNITATEVAATGVPKSSTLSIRLNIDNIHPEDDNAGVLVSDSEREPVSRGGHIKMIGTQALLSSRGIDTGSKIEKAIVYFESGGRIFSMGGLDPDGTGADAGGTAMGTITINPGETYAQTFYCPVASLDDLLTGKTGGIAQKYMVIDHLEGDNDEGGAGDKDGYNENLAADGNWRVYANSTLIPDGVYNVHYVLVDSAKNAYHYADTALVQNNKPVLTSIKLYTDVTGNGAIDATDDDDNVERKAFTSIAASIATGFTVRGNLFRIQLEGTFTNTGIAYHLSYDKGSGTFAEVSPEVAGGNVFLLDAEADFGADGAATFKVWAEDGLTPYTLMSTVSNLSVTLDNDDGENPTIELYEINTTPVNDPANTVLGNYAAQLAYALKRTGSAAGSLVQFNTDPPSPEKAERNILSGHVEPRNRSTYGGAATDPDLSGVVILRGKAHDNQRIASLALSINGGAYATILDSDAATGKLKVASGYSGLADMPSQTLSLTTHDVEWSYAWDTATLTTVVGNDVSVSVRVTDAAPLQSAAVSYPAAKYNAMTVDVVPYMRRITTPKPTTSGIKEVNLRGASGNYSVRQGADATFITVYGYNLNPMTDGVRISNEANKAGLAGTTLLGSPVAFTTVSGDTTKLYLSNNIASSGYLTIVNLAGASRIPTLNNVNYSDPAAIDYNDEPDPYVRKNSLLKDDRYLRMFAVRDTGVKNGYYPEMVMEGNDPVFGFVNLTGGPNYPVERLDGTANYGAGSYYPSHAMPQRAKFNGTSAAEIYTEYLIKASIWDQMGMARDDGGRYVHASVYNRDNCGMSILYDRYAELYADGMGWGTGTGYSGYDGDWSENGGNNAISLERTNFTPGLLLGRYQYPKMIALGNSRTSHAKVYMLYYDDNTSGKELIFRNLRIGTDVTGGGTSALYSGGASSTGDGYAQRKNLGDENTTGRLTAATNASKHFDMAVTPDFRVIIVYYDENDGRLKMRYSAGAVDGSNPTAAVTWTNSPVVFPDYVGNYVSMALDSAGGIHIAAYDSGDSDLRYMYMTGYDSATVNTVTVDAAFSVGNWTKIKLRESAGNVVPYIAYYNSSETGSRDPIKLAYCLSPITSSNVPAGVDSSGETTGFWEYMTVPANTPPQGGDTKFKQVNLGFDTAGNPVLGYLGTNLEFTKVLPEN